MCETHTAIVFFAGDRAYKLKKPVDQILDYTTVVARRAACEREVALNHHSPRRLSGAGWTAKPSAQAPEPLVVMHRMPEPPAFHPPRCGKG
ncbi:putative protein [Streptomyces griseoloalbus]